ncbi:MAG: PKD domain-containing protein [Euryarchaeota archaeon]|nr:PKD domain-containing protein [Euryarchaeota archaeon]
MAGPVSLRFFLIGIALVALFASPPTLMSHSVSNTLPIRAHAVASGTSWVKSGQARHAPPVSPTPDHPQGLARGFPASRAPSLAHPLSSESSGVPHVVERDQPSSIEDAKPFTPTPPGPQDQAFPSGQDENVLTTSGAQVGAPGSAPSPSVRLSTNPTWEQEPVVPIGSPDGAAMTDDIGDMTILYFGGTGFSSRPQAITWEMSSTGWENLTGSMSLSPPACTFCAMSWDSKIGQVVLFDQGTWTFLSDQWAQASPQASPPTSLTQEAIVDDPSENGVLVFGGTYTAPGCGCAVTTGATWVYMTSNWVNVSGALGTPPSPRRGATMVTDSADNYPMLFGGWSDVSQSVLSDTWGLWNNQWVYQSTLGPSARTNARLADDIMDGYVLLYGGSGCGGAGGMCSDTWTWHAGGWTELFPSISPYPESSSQQVMVYDSASSYVVFLEAGPTSGSFTSNESVPFSWPSALQASLTASRTTLDANQTLRAVITASGGMPPLRYFWYNVPSGCSSPSNYLNCTPTLPWTGTITGEATDQSGRTASPTLAFTILSDPSVPPPSPNLPSVDVGRPVSFTAAATGGSGSFTYAWNAPSAMGCGGGGSGTLTCTPSAAGRYQVATYATDSDGFTVSAVSAPFLVSAGPTVTLAENRTNLDLGESIFFWANASGGTGTYSYTYNGLPSGCTSQNVSTLSCGPAVVGSQTITVSVKDTGGGSATSAAMYFGVNPDPTFISYWRPGSEVVNRSGIWYSYINWSGTYQLDFSGGTPSYDYCLVTVPATLAAGCSGTTGVTSFFFAWFFWPSNGMPAGTYTLTFSAHDSTGWNDTAVVTLVLYWPPSLGPLAHPNPEDQGQQVTASSWLSHGAAPLSYWMNATGTPSPLCSAQVATTPAFVSCTFVNSWVGNEVIRLTARSSLGLQVFSNATLVSNRTTTLTLSPAPALAPVDRPFEIGALISGGSSPYRLCTQVPSWGGALSCLPLSGSPVGSFSYQGSSLGQVTIGVSVVDAAGLNRTYWTNVTLVPDLSSASLAGPSWGYATWNVTLNASFQNGVAPYSLWFNDTSLPGPLCPSVLVAWVATVPCTFELAWTGSHTLRVTVRDAFGENQTANLTLVGYPPIALSSVTTTTGPSLVRSGGILYGEVAGPVFLNASFSGGKGLRQYSWWIGGLLIAEGNGSAVLWQAVWVPLAAGTYLAIFDLSDSVGTEVSGSVTLRVGPGLSGLSIQGHPSTVDVQTDSNVSASFTSGASPFTYVWAVEVSPGVQQAFSTTVPWLVQSWAAAGAYSVVLTVYDADHFAATARTTLTVNPAPTVPCGPASSSDHRTPGSLLNFTLGCLSGGTGPYRVVWSWGDGSDTTGSALNATHVYSRTGNFSVTATVTDAFGLEALSVNLSVEVVPIAQPSGRSPPPTSGALAWFESWGLWVDALLLGVALLLALLVLRRSRGNRRLGRRGGSYSLEGEGEGQSEDGPLSSPSEPAGGPPKGSSSPDEVSEEDLKRSAEIDAAILEFLGQHHRGGLQELRGAPGTQGVGDPALLEHLFALKSAGRIVLLPESQETDSPVYALAPRSSGREEEPIAPVVDEAMVNDYLSRRASSLAEDGGEEGLSGEG